MQNDVLYYTGINAMKKSAFPYKPSLERDGSWKVPLAMEKSVSLWSGIS